MKKIITVFGVAILATVLLFNVSISGKNSASNPNLTKVMMTNEANAECLLRTLEIGKCLAGSCFPGHAVDCDSDSGF